VIDDRPKQFRSAIKARILSLDESPQQPPGGKMSIAALTLSGSSLVGWLIRIGSEADSTAAGARIESRL
jgi:hypothetical protein